MNTRRTFIKKSTGTVLAFGLGVGMTSNALAFSGNRFKFGACSGGSCSDASTFSGTAGFPSGVSGDWCRVTCTAPGPLGGTVSGFGKCETVFEVITWCEG